MRKLTFLAAFGILLLVPTGCIGAEAYDEHITYRVYDISALVGPSRAHLVISGPIPGEPIKPVSHVSADLDAVPSDIEVGDILLCRVQQHRKNLADTNVAETVSDCRRP